MVKTFRHHLQIAGRAWARTSGAVRRVLRPWGPRSTAGRTNFYWGPETFEHEAVRTWPGKIRCFSLQYFIEEESLWYAGRDDVPGVGGLLLESFARDGYTPLARCCMVQALQCQKWILQGFCIFMHIPCTMYDDWSRALACMDPCRLSPCLLHHHAPPPAPQLADVAPPGPGPQPMLRSTINRRQQSLPLAPSHNPCVQRRWRATMRYTTRLSRCSPTGSRARGGS